MISAACLAIAVNSKINFFVIGPVALAIDLMGQTALIFRTPASERGKRLACVAVLVVVSPLMFFAPLKNIIEFGNPLYPFNVSVGAYQLSGDETPTYFGPDMLAKMAQPARYVLSQLDLDAIDNRPGGFTLDQGYVASGADSDRIGGSLSVLLIVSVFGLVIGLVGQTNGLALRIAMAQGVALMVIVACFPSSHELRYFCFVNILLSIAGLALLKRLASASQYHRGVLQGLYATILGSVAFTGFATGLRHVGTAHDSTLGEILEAKGFERELDRALLVSNTICYVRRDTSAFYFSPLLNPAGRGRDYRVVSPSTVERCPPGATIVQ